MITHSSIRRAAAALVALLLGLSGAGAAAGAEWQKDFVLSGTGKLKAKGLGTLKIPVTASLHMLPDMAAGSWQVFDGTALLVGTYYALDTKGRKFSVSFSLRALSQLGDELRAEVLSETGLDAQVLSISQRNAVFKVDKKWSKGSIKLVFDITALVNGEVRTATYTVPLKARVLPV